MKRTPLARSFKDGGACVNTGPCPARPDFLPPPIMITPLAMGQERISDALSRIEKALARVEGAAERAPAPSAASDDSALREAHETLRGKVEGAIAQIDALLQSEGAR